MSKKTHIEYGFWKSDQFPFVLSSPGEMQDNGWFAALRYHNGQVKPIKVLPLEEGEALAAKLAELEAEFRFVRSSVFEGFKSRLRNLAPFTLATDRELSSKEAEPSKGRKSVGKRAGK